jgi:hypothetical protein
MSNADNDEGADFEALFMQHKTAQPLLSPVRTQTRLTAERRAARTPKQRENLSEPRKMVNFRATAETRALIIHLAKHLTGGDRTALMHLALHELAKTAPPIGGARQ